MTRLLALTVALCIIIGCCHAADPKPKINEITAVIKTFERPACLARLLTSIQEHAPGLKVIVVDDGKDAAENRREATQNAGLVIQYFVLDHDTGIAAARNFAISKVKTKYVVIMDDDFVMTAESKLTELAAVAGQVHGIAGGELYVHPDQLPDIPFLSMKRERQTVSMATLLSLNPKKKSLSSTPEKWKHPGTGCIQASMVTTFWAAETSMFEKLKWDEQFKLNEAEDFFLRAQELRIPVHYCSKVKALHDGQCTTADGQDPARYKRKRERGLHYSKKFFEKWNIVQHSTSQGGMYFKTCAFDKKDKSDCGVAHMWKRDELMMCDEHGNCSMHKVKIDKKPGTKQEGLYKCDASGKCDVPVIH